MFMEYIMHTKKIAIGVLGALFQRNPALQDVSSDPEALIAEVAICNAVHMHYNYVYGYVITLFNAYHVCML